MNSTRKVPFIILLLLIGLLSGGMACIGPSNNNQLHRIADVVYPPHNPKNLVVQKLGEKLFFDLRLSADGKVSCASCHLPDQAFTDGKTLSDGVFNRKGFRNAPSLLNIAYHPRFFWDGGAMSLEQQVFGPLEDENEMGANLQDVLQFLQNNAEYTALFNQAFKEQPSSSNLAKALANYQRALISFGSAYDHFLKGDNKALSVAAKRGLLLFEGKAQCANCHVPPMLSDFSYRHNGLYNASESDLGRGRVTLNPEDNGRFKVQPLRNIALTAPYMHDGRFQDLRQVLEHYNAGGNNHPNKDHSVRPLDLTENEITDLQHFLESLTDTEFNRASDL